MPLLFKGNARGYFAAAALGVAAGLLAAALSLLPHGTLWSFSSFGSGTIGFWMFFNLDHCAFERVPTGSRRKFQHICGAYVRSHGHI